MGAIDLAGHRVLADIGGGSGTYSMLMLQRYPGLRVRILDLAPILEAARTLVASSTVGDRIEMVPCGATADDLGNGFDAAPVSGLSHRMTAETSRIGSGRRVAPERHPGPPSHWCPARVTPDYVVISLASHLR